MDSGADDIFYTQGCKDLLIRTDHKLLLKLLGDRTLDEIHNICLFRLKERTMMWCFRVQHRPGKEYLVADVDCASEIALVNVLREGVNKIHAITWDRAKLEIKRDSDMIDLLNLANSGFNDAK